jgi:hypothetical protein
MKKFSDRAGSRQPDPDLPAKIERNKAAIEAARARMSVPDVERLHLQFNASGSISGGDIKEAFRAAGLDPKDLSIRCFSPARVPYLVSSGTDRDGERHYDHGSEDCALALKEHGMHAMAYILAQCTFVSPLDLVRDDQMYHSGGYYSAIAVYHRSCLYPMESSFGNLSNGFHYFLCPPSRALAGYVDDPATTSQAYADMSRTQRETEKSNLRIYHR